MSETISGLLDLARTGATPEAATSRLRAVVAEAVATAGGERPGLTVDVPEDHVVALPHTLAVRALAPVIDNALRLAEHVRVDAAPDGRGFVAVRVADDGPGVPVDRRALRLRAGHTDGSGSGAGLGLALVAADRAQRRRRRTPRRRGGPDHLRGPAAARLRRPDGSGSDRGRLRVDDRENPVTPRGWRHLGLAP